MSFSSRDRKNLFTALGFLAPNILGVLVFTLFPLIFSIVLAFSNWDLTLHNMFKDEPIKMVGFDNFVRLFQEGDLMRFLVNTLFLMIGIPLGMAGSLFAAILLNQDVRGGSKKTFAGVMATMVFVLSICALASVGMGQSSMMMLLIAVVGLIMVIGFGGGLSGYRTLFYVPHFTAGVATFILWKKLYNPSTGVINNAIRGPLKSIGELVNSTSPGLMTFFVAMFAVFTLVVLILGLRRFAQQWRDGELGTGGYIVCMLFLSLPVFIALNWATLGTWRYVVGGGGLAMVLLIGGGAFVKGQDFDAESFKGMDVTGVFALVVMGVVFMGAGLTAVMINLPEMSGDANGLEPPKWLVEYDWAKPAIMIMGLWGAIGSNNMLLYLAALTNVPQDLYEAADIDGAGPMNKFWNVTWPCLAPTTFFIGVMSIIGGLQGGMEMARVMTNGGPAGSTTTLAYFIYTEGFETGRLGFSSAIAWTLFVLVFTVTMINWKFGNRRTA